MELNKKFRLPAISGTETSAAEDENHGMLSLQFGKLSTFRSVVRELIIRKDNTWKHVWSHMKSSVVTLLAELVSVWEPRFADSY